MKSILFMLLLCGSLNAQWIQLPRNAAGAPEYSGVMKMDSFSKNQLYDLCESFLAGLTRGGDSNLKYQNKDMGKVVWRGVVRCAPVSVGIGSPTGSYWQFKFTIEVKDHKIRYTINDFQLQYEPENGYYAGKLSVESLYADSLKMGSKKLMKLHNGSIECLDRDVNGLVKALNDHLLSAKLPKNDW